MSDGDQTGATQCRSWNLDGVDFRGLDYRKAREVAYLTPDDLTITPEWLVGVAAKADDRYRELLSSFPVGTVHDERNIMRELREDAVKVAEWLEKRSVAGVRFAGPFGPRLPKRADSVQIRSGSVVYSTHPSDSRSKVTLQRALTITVRSCDRGYVDATAREDRGEAVVSAARVHWSGTGGYWRWTDAENIVAD